MMRGEKETFPGWCDRYHVDGGFARMKLPQRPIDRIFMREQGRFGNRIVQLKHALHVAGKVDAKVLQMSGTHNLFKPQKDNSIILSDKSEVPKIAGKEVVLRGGFYYRPTLNIDLANSDHADLIRRYIRPIIKDILLTPDPRVGPNEMALHFRAGDIMSGPKVNRNYGQPPVSYYLKAAELSGANRFWLVYEDLSNPAIKIVEQKLKERGHEVILQSGNLEEDCRVIMSVDHLAASTGTFGYALAELSTRLRTFYCFTELRSYPLDVFENTPVNAVRIVDGEGTYNAELMSKNWTASDAQLAMIVSYPERHLKVIQ